MVLLMLPILRPYGTSETLQQELNGHDGFRPGRDEILVAMTIGYLNGCRPKILTEAVQRFGTYSALGQTAGR